MSVRKRRVLDNLEFHSTPKYEICLMYTERRDIHICMYGVFSSSSSFYFYVDACLFSSCILLYLCAYSVYVWMFGKRIQQPLHRNEHLIYIKLWTANIYVKFHTWVEMHVMLLCVVIRIHYFFFSITFAVHNLGGGKNMSALRAIDGVRKRICIQWTIIQNREEYT